MAVEEITFYDINGEEINITNLVDQMIDYYEQKLELEETKITDFNEGSEIRGLLEAYAVLAFNKIEAEYEAGQLPFISTSYGAYLDKIGENPFINLPRIVGSVSQGEATFTLSEVQENDITIPAGTLLTDVNDLDYVTEYDSTIYAGDTSTIVVVSCLTEGYEGNIQVGELTTISDPDIDTDLLSVTNNISFINGASDEGDEEYRIRLLEHVQMEGFGSLPYYENLACSIGGVHDVKFIAQTGYTRKVLVNGYVKNTPNSVLTEVLAELSDESNHSLDHTFLVGLPGYNNIDLTFNMSVSSEYTSAYLTEFLNAVVNGGGFEQMEFAGLNIGEQLTADLLINSLMLLGNINEVEILAGGSEFTSTSYGETAVAKLRTLTFNQTVE